MLRIGIVGLGSNTRARHVPGLRACQDVEIVGLVNRRPASTAAAAAEFGIPQTYAQWQDLVGEDNIDAVVIGTWPYLHCEITVAALEAGKHVLTEARMAMDAAQAHQMLAASLQHPDLVTQIVPSPMGFRGLHVVRSLIDSGALGELREVIVLATSDALADPDTPLHWRQHQHLSGQNMLALGIIHEAVTRWIPEPIRVWAQTQTFTRQRRDADTGQLVEVGIPDSVHVMTELPNSGRGLYHLSGAIHFGPPPQVHFYGSEATLKYEFEPTDKIWFGQRGGQELQELPVPPEKAYAWRVEQDFVEAIRGERLIELTDFASGVRYMEFTQGVVQSAATGRPVELPLDLNATP